MAFSITVVFPNDADAEYDIDYYTKNHMPLIEKHWSKFGLKGWSVTRFVPGLDGSKPLYAFGSEVFWESEEGIKNAFASPETAEIMGDIPRFSNKVTYFPDWGDHEACLQLLSIVSLTVSPFSRTECNLFVCRGTYGLLPFLGYLIYPGTNRPYCSGLDSVLVLRLETEN
jgi:uncharacterized protein (TIGR02118 family)